MEGGSLGALDGFETNLDALEPVPDCHENLGEILQFTRKAPPA